MIIDEFNERDVQILKENELSRPYSLRMMQYIKNKKNVEYNINAYYCIYGYWESSNSKQKINSYYCKLRHNIINLFKTVSVGKLRRSYDALFRLNGAKFKEAQND